MVEYGGGGERLSAHFRAKALNWSEIENSRKLGTEFRSEVKTRNYQTNWVGGAVEPALELRGNAGITKRTQQAYSGRRPGLLDRESGGADPTGSLNTAQSGRIHTASAGSICTHSVTRARFLPILRRMRDLTLRRRFIEGVPVVGGHVIEALGRRLDRRA